MKAIWTAGEALCEIMRETCDVGLEAAGTFRGPFPSGAPAIFADTAAKLGCPSGLIGTVGDDAFGRCILKRFEQDGVDCSCVRVSGDLPTAVAFVSYTAAGDRTFIFHIGNAAAKEIHCPETMPQNVGAFHVMGCAIMASAGIAQNVYKATQYYYEQGAVISFDPNIRLESLRGQDLRQLIAPIMARCSIFMPGLDELTAIAGVETVEAAAERLFRNPVLKVIVLKNGGKGSRIITRKSNELIPACKVMTLDSTGAGDSFDAGFMVAYLEGHSLTECAQAASATAALNCAAFGPMEGNITRAAVNELAHKNYGINIL